MILKILKAYYLLTAWIPRRLPINADEWALLEQRLFLYYGVPDQPEFWATVAGHVMSTPAYKLRRSYAFLANTANRLTTNQAAQARRMAAGKALEARLQAAIAKEATNTETGGRNYVCKSCWDRGLRADHITLGTCDNCNQSSSVEVTP